MSTLLKKMSTRLVTAPKGLTELVKGSERELLAHVGPLVRTNNVILDCEAIERIDAAGIAALISLYCDAQDSGHSFYVCHVQTHVAEILALVGLNHILVADGTDRGAYLTRTAA